MYSSEIIRYARSLSNMPKADSIDWNDEMSSLNHSYKDIYAKIAFAKAAYDYMTVGPVLLDMTTAVQLGTTEWTIELPDDVYSLRYVDFNRNGYWANMALFNINERNFVGGAPKYRWLGDKLWVTGVMPTQIRIRYFPPPIVPSIPDTAYQYALQYPPYELPQVDSPQYFSLPDPVNEGDNDYCLYTFGGTTITLESYSLNSVYTVYVSTGLSQAYYNLGYVYFLQGGDIYRATTSLTSIDTPSKLTTDTGILNYSIVGKKIYYSTRSATYTINLDGSTRTQYKGYQITNACAYTSGSIAYIKMSDGLIYIDSTATTIGAENLTSDGVYLYYLNSAGAISRLTLDTQYKALGDYIIYAGAQYLGSFYRNRISLVDNQYGVYAVSTFIDTNFDYPLNDGFEIMAYQSAIDFKRKEQADYTQLQQRLGEIWVRFELTLKRDSGRPEHRIADSVKNNVGFFY